METHDGQHNIFPGGLNTTVISAQESGRAPFDGEVIPQARWTEFTDGFSKAYEYVQSEEGAEFYKSVDSELFRIAIASPDPRTR